MLDELQIIECEQNSDAWYEARSGIVTASDFVTVMASGRGGKPSVTRKRLMATKAAELITGAVTPTWQGNEHTERGHVLEEEIRDLFEAASVERVVQAGLMRRGQVGWRPDGLVGGSGQFEARA